MDDLMNSALDGLFKARTAEAKAFENRVTARTEHDDAKEQAQRQRHHVALLLAHRVSPYFMFTSDPVRRAFEKTLQVFFVRLLEAQEDAAAADDTFPSVAKLRLSDIKDADMAMSHYARTPSIHDDVIRWREKAEAEAEEEEVVVEMGGQDDPPED